MGRDEAGKAIRKRAMEGCPLARELLILRGMCSCQGDEESVDEAEDRYLELAALRYAVPALQAEIEALRAEVGTLREALEDIRSRSSIDLVMRSDRFELTARLGDIYQIADAALSQQPEAGRDEYHRCGKNIRRHKMGECRPQAQEAVRLLRELRDAARAYWDGGMVGAAEKRDRFRLALRAAGAYIADAQYGGRGDE